MHLSFCTKCFCFEVAIPLVNFQKYKMYEKNDYAYTTIRGHRESKEA